MIAVEFNATTGILESKFVDEITLDHLVGYIDATRENSSYPRKLKILSDAIHSQFNFSVDDLEAIVEANNRSLMKYTMIIDAIVIDSPREAALTFLYQELAKNRKYQFKVFNTLRGANLWLQRQ